MSYSPFFIFGFFSLCCLKIDVFFSPPFRLRVGGCRVPGRFGFVLIGNQMGCNNVLVMISSLLAWRSDTLRRNANIDVCSSRGDPLGATAAGQDKSVASAPLFSSSATVAKSGWASGDCCWVASANSRSVGERSARGFVGKVRCFSLNCLTFVASSISTPVVEVSIEKWVQTPKSASYSGVANRRAVSVCPAVLNAQVLCARTLAPHAMRRREMSMLLRAADT